MKILHLNYNDMRGGSAKSAYRLHRALLAAGIDSKMLVSLKQRKDKEIVGAETRLANLTRRLRLGMDKLPLLGYPQRPTTPFSTQWLPNGMVRQVQTMKPDIVNLHWIGHGMLSITSLNDLPRPIVWTLHDVWPFTGGCHVNGDCHRYRQACGCCPQLGSAQGHDLSNKIWRHKQEHWRNVELTLVAPSQWMARVAEESQLLPQATIEVIPHGVDTQIYRPLSKLQARAKMNLPSEKQLILVGSAGGRHHKGFDLLHQAIDRLGPEKRKAVNLVVFGPEQSGLECLDIDVYQVGNIADEEKLATLYAAADITVVPSRQESFGLIALESLACGTPVVAFATSGLLDVINHAEDGYLARPFIADDLAKGIIWTLAKEARMVEMGENARAKAASEFDIAVQAARYQALYNGYG